MSFQIKTTKTFQRLTHDIGAGCRVAIRQGGTASSKTFSTLQYLIALADNSKRALTMSVVAETYPHLRRGAMRDFFNILGDSYSSNCHNKSESIYRINKSQIEFFSADQPAKVRGPRRHILFVNEANNVPKETFTQLEIRTEDLIIADFNPTSHFYLHDLIGDSGVAFDISTYKDNRYLAESVVRSIESKKNKDANWWRVYGEGQVGQLEGLIFPEFEQIDRFPDGLQVRYGLDFGFTNDPTALIRIGVTADTIYLDECIYDTALTNSDIGKRMDQHLKRYESIIFADSAEPKSIVEFKRMGFNIRPAPKGPDTILFGIDYIKRYNVKVTKRSIGLIKELRNYRWEKGSDGSFINVPIDLFNHAIDATRYGLSDRIQQNQSYGMRVAI